MLNNWFKKEKPIQGMMGFGGGATGYLKGAGGGGILASGGIESEADGMKFHRFVTPNNGRGSSTHTFTIQSGAATCNIMVVGGGGAGGYANEGHGGGGGGGMVDLPESAPQNVELGPGNYPINVGNGGESNLGGQSVFVCPSFTLVGKGGGRYSPGGCGGGGRGDSGACSSATQPGQPGLSGNYGHGYPSGCGVGPEQGEGGGGTGQQGGNSGQNGYGGAGRKPPWLPTSFGDQGRFGGGGGAGVRSPGPSGGPGGAGGGGRGYQNNRQPDINGTNGLGGGAGGGQESGVSPGAGGSGCVIIAYPI